LQLWEVLDAAAYLRNQLGPLLGHRRDQHPGMVQVPAVGEPYIGVVDAFLSSDCCLRSSSGTYRRLCCRLGRTTTRPGRVR
jgi:hypothetical protein